MAVPGTSLPGHIADIAIDVIWASIDCDDLTFTNIERQDQAAKLL